MTTVHELSMERARISLEGLSVGDSFGENFFIDTNYVREVIAGRNVPAPIWPFTDDTNMALSLVASFRRYQKIEQDWLAQNFADYFDPMRGYGRGMHTLMREIKAGRHWSKSTKTLFNGQGSFGNGAAMRVAPLGGYFADDLYLTVQQASLSAEVTHAHLEGVAGAIAVAVAAALAWQNRGTTPSLPDFIDQILPYVPASEVQAGLLTARNLPPDTPIARVTHILGNGSGVIAQDTVPFAIWCAAQHLDNYEEALWLTVSGLGDIDTNCAIVGGIVALHTGVEGIPAAWQAAREPLPNWPFE